MLYIWIARGEINSARYIQTTLVPFFNLASLSLSQPCLLFPMLCFCLSRLEGNPSYHVPGRRPCPLSRPALPSRPGRRVRGAASQQARRGLFSLREHLQRNGTYLLVWEGRHNALYMFVLNYCSSPIDCWDSVGSHDYLLMLMLTEYLNLHFILLLFCTHHV